MIFALKVQHDTLKNLLLNTFIGFLVTNAWSSLLL